MFSFIGKAIGTVVGTAVGITVAPIAIALGITEDMVNAAIKAGCATVEEIKEFYRL